MDGAPFQPQTEGLISNEIVPAQVEAVEVYRNAAETPIEFRTPGSDCGVVVIWTRGSR